MESRIKQLREKRGLIQEILAIEVFWNGKRLADAIAAGERYDVI